MAQPLPELTNVLVSAQSPDAAVRQQAEQALEHLKQSQPAAYLAALAGCRGVAGFGWRTERYEFVDDVPALDLLTGDGEVRAGLDAGAALDDLLAVGAVRMDDWRRSVRDRWIYPGATH